MLEVQAETSQGLQLVLVLLPVPPVHFEQPQGRDRCSAGHLRQSEYDARSAQSLVPVSPTKFQYLVITYEQSTCLQPVRNFLTGVEHFVLLCGTPTI